MTDSDKPLTESDLDQLQVQKPLQKHKLKTPAECDCDKTSSYPPCPICDWGLAVCSVCGAAESELDKPCNPPLTTTQALNLLDIGLDTDLADGAAIGTTPAEELIQEENE